MDRTEGHPCDVTVMQVNRIIEESARKQIFVNFGTQNFIPRQPRQWLQTIETKPVLDARVFFSYRALLVWFEIVVIYRELHKNSPISDSSSGKK